jgi:hypothetical protein
MFNLRRYLIPSQRAGSGSLCASISASPVSTYRICRLSSKQRRDQKGRAAMIGTASLSFDHASEQVEGMVLEGAAFGRVEDVIDAAQLSGRHKAALWLLAWSLREPLLQRREARLLAGAFGPGGED